MNHTQYVLYKRTASDALLYNKEYDHICLGHIWKYFDREIVLYGYDNVTDFINQWKRPNCSDEYRAFFMRVCVYAPASMIDSDMKWADEKLIDLFCPRQIGPPSSSLSV